MPAHVKQTSRVSDFHVGDMESNPLKSGKGLHYIKESKVNAIILRPMINIIANSLYSSF